MKKIMVATDYSESANSSVQYGVSLANHFGSLLSLVSAVEEPYSAAAGALIDVKDHIRDEAMETMDKVKREVSGQLTSGATIDTHTVDGEPGPTITRVAKAKDYNLIVTGTKGSDAARELFTGSVANSVIKNSKLPVLVVPDKIPFREFRRILIAVDEKSLAGSHVLQPLIDVLSAYDAELIVYHGDEDGDGKGYDPRLGQYLGDVNHRFEVRSGKDDSIAEGIEQAVKLHDADLLVMIYHDRGFFGRLFNESTVSKVVFKSTVPLLVLQDV
ncbi:nucleotide-binding universal stress UspA family protein [Neolewinella xylanilytica]|uniref:Nucleotide-binding universal stress UspA family protein n=1 Tax=Neolewinella xylanilytica TaxID=1514080 RepID=A0A2S6I2Q5_9BACT|nr:universal stress protein [Neolewinella xylanilytica]PPK85457.1 nucleotide-binding universal stress UspA family protein [Neolewinella xylanilytica]